MSNDWHYTKDNWKHGPVSLAHLKELADQGSFGPDDLVWQPGMPTWVLAKSLRGLFLATDLTAEVATVKSADHVQNVAAAEVEPEPTLVAPVEIVNHNRDDDEDEAERKRKARRDAPGEVAESREVLPTQTLVLCALAVALLSLVAVGASMWFGLLGGGSSGGATGPLAQAGEGSIETTAERQLREANELNAYLARVDGQEPLPGLKTYFASKGPFRGSIPIEVDRAEGLELGAIKVRTSGWFGNISCNLTREVGNPRLQLRFPKDYYHFTTYAQDGMPLTDKNLTHEEIGPGQTVPAKFSFPLDKVARIKIHREGEAVLPPEPTPKQP